jgi:hypothetical protein
MSASAIGASRDDAARTSFAIPLEASEARLPRARGVESLTSMLDGLLRDLATHRPRHAPQVIDVEGPSADLPASSPPPIGDVLPPDLAALLAQANGDPLLLLSLVDSAIQATRLEANVQSVDSARQTSERAATERERAIDAAIRRAARRSRMPKWLRKVLKAIAVVASTIASAVSGGVLAAVAIAGTVLMLSANHIGELAVKLGMDPEKAKWLVLGLQLVGAAMSMAAGGVGAAGGSPTARLVERVAELTADVIGGTEQVLAGSEHIAQSVFTAHAMEAAIAADLAGVRFDTASQELDDAVRVLRDGMRSLESSMQGRVDALLLRSEAARAVLHRAI